MPACQIVIFAEYRDGGVCQRAMSLANHWWLWRCFLHGTHRWTQKASHLFKILFMLCQTSVTWTLNNHVHTIHTCYTKLRLQNLFLTDCIFQGGGFFNMLGGAYNAPAGYQRRLMGGIIRVKERWVLSSLESENIIDILEKTKSLKT